MTDTLMHDKEALIERCIPFLDEVKDMTTGTAVEHWLNQASTDPAASSTRPWPAWW
jgi:hypothetical protein